MCVSYQFDFFFFAIVVNNCIYLYGHILIDEVDDSVYLATFFFQLSCKQFDFIWLRITSFKKTNSFFCTLMQKEWKHNLLSNKALHSNQSQNDNCCSPFSYYVMEQLGKDWEMIKNHNFPVKSHQFAKNFWPHFSLLWCDAKWIAIKTDFMVYIYVLFCSRITRLSDPTIHWCLNRSIAGQNNRCNTIHLYLVCFKLQDGKMI